MLIRTHARQHPSTDSEIPEEQWPTTIARLKPERVTVHASGVDILVKAGFDGGYGYEVPRIKTGLSMPVACYSELSSGVFWHGPC